MKLIVGLFVSLVAMTSVAQPILRTVLTTNLIPPRIQIVGLVSNQVPVIVSAATNQTTNTFEVKNSAGTIVYSINSNGVPSASGPMTPASPISSVQYNSNGVLSGSALSISNNTLFAATGSVLIVEGTVLNHSDQSINLPFDSAIRGSSRGGSNFHMLRVPDVAGIDGGTADWMLIGDTRMNWISMAADLDMIQQDIIDVADIGNVLAVNTHTRIVQKYPDASLTVGFATLNAAGATVNRLIVSNYLNDTKINLYYDPANDMALAVRTNGNLTFTPSGNSTSTFNITGAGGTNILRVDSMNQLVGIYNGYAVSGLNPALVISGDYFGAGAGHSIDFMHATLTANPIARISANSDPPGDYFGELAFSTGDNLAAPVERMRISRVGYVGIGTNFPQTTLHVAGNSLAHGYHLVTNAAPPATAITAGGSFFWNSNSTVYLLTSSPGSTAWAATNKLAP